MAEQYDNMQGTPRDVLSHPVHSTPTFAGGTPTPRSDPRYPEGGAMTVGPDHSMDRSGQFVSPQPSYEVKSKK